MTMVSAPSCILAYTSEDERYRPVRQAATALAKESGARLILYDIDAASMLNDPLPNEWASQGEHKLFGNPLSEEDLERAGREPIAAQVREARGRGVEAFGWLPSDKGADALVDYAARQGADLILLPKNLDEGMLARFRGSTAEKTQEQAAEKTGARVALVDDSGQLEYCS